MNLKVDNVRPAFILQICPDTSQIVEDRVLPQLAVHVREIRNGERTEVSTVFYEREKNHLRGTSTMVINKN